MVSSLGLLYIKVMWRFVNRFLCEHKFSFLWDKFQKYNCEYYSCMLSFVRNNGSVFQSGVEFYIPTSNVWVIQFLYFLTNSWCYNLIILAILIGVQWYLILVLICIYLMANCWKSFTCLSMSLVKYLFLPFVHVLLDLFLLLCIEHSFYTLDTSPFLGM